MKNICHFVKRIPLFFIIVGFLLALNHKIAVGPFGKFMDGNVMDVVLWVTAIYGIVNLITQTSHKKFNYKSLFLLALPA